MDLKLAQAGHRNEILYGEGHYRPDHMYAHLRTGLFQLV
jgi:hypothetical protein